MIKKVVTQIQTGSKSNPVICAVELRQDKTATDLSSEKTQEATNDTTVSGFATGFNDGDFTTGGGFNFPAIDFDTMRLIAGNLLSGTKVVETPIVSNWINAYKNVTLTTSLQNVNASGKSTVQAKIVVDSGDSIFKNESILFAQFLFKDVGELGETKTITLTNQSVDSPDDYIEITLSSSVKIGTRYLGYVRGQFFGFKATTGMELVQRLYAIQESVTTGMGEEYKQFLTFPWSMSHTKACIPTSFTQSVEIISDDNSKDCNTTLSTLFNGLYMENLDIDIKKGGTSSSTSLIGTEFATEETSKTMLDYIKDEKYFEKELKDQNVDLVGIAEIDKKGIYGLSGELKVDETSFDNPFPARGVHLLKGANAGHDVKVTVYYKRGETGNKIGVEKEFSFKNSANEEIFRVKTGTDLDDGDIYIFVVGDTYGKLVLIDDSPAENVNRNTNINPNTVGDYGSYFKVVSNLSGLSTDKSEVKKNIGETFNPKDTNSGTKFSVVTSFTTSSSTDEKIEIEQNSGIDKEVNGYTYVGTGDKIASAKTASLTVGTKTLKIQLGKDVLAGKYNSLREVLLSGNKIMESEIVDKLDPNFGVEYVNVGQAKGKFGGGKRKTSKQTQKITMEGSTMSFMMVTLTGNRDGIVGLGFGKSRETVPSREKAIRNGKLNLALIRRGCGDWGCFCGTAHSIPFAVEGRSGSCTVKLMPAPKGTGLVVESELKKMLELAGIKDVWSKTYGSTKNKVNLMKAGFEALKALQKVRLTPEMMKGRGIKEGDKDE